CVPRQLARRVTEELSIPTIGIGAGPDTDGQVLVMQDMLGMNPEFKPRFLRHYADGRGLIHDAVDRFAEDTRSGAFPATAESYG
ncbi:MAG: 3-methyl-2-oxobutanoate hydroxymethyltransferase, partial [Gammaproteobacteria bacterium]|nr:3-methyl-2-oxobutanoate hydroxymethyltransferase [Gammaproteobacteria bacterium]